MCCTETSSAVKCVERCWCFGGDQIYCQRRHESQYDKTVVGDSRGHCVAISVYVQAYTPHDEDENMVSLVSCTPVL